MSDPQSIAEAVATAASWNARVGLIRRIPEEFGVQQHAAVYAAVAQRVYVPSLAPDFAYVHWRADYELPHIATLYRRAYDLTAGFTKVGADDLAAALTAEPGTVAIFRLMLGLIGREFDEVCAFLVREHGLPGLGPATSAAAIDRIMRGELFPALAGDSKLRRKLDKPDTAQGWESVRQFATHGVPYEMFLHQRAYGGAFRQLLDATSSQRGDILEEPVEALFVGAGIPYVRTGAFNQAEIERRFGLTVKPAPDFVVFDQATDALRGLLECKLANDGGTARDKAARFRSLRAEGARLGGVPLFAVLGGLGWRRTNDALGPVVRDADGRVFTLGTLPEMLECEPFPRLRGTAKPSPDTTAELAADKPIEDPESGHSGPK